jgi:hypothetical protein
MRCSRWRITPPWMTTTAMCCDVLLALAVEHGGMYREAVDAIYPIELRALGRWKALTCRVVDLHQMKMIQAQDHASEGDRDI